MEPLSLALTRWLEFLEVDRWNSDTCMSTQSCIQGCPFGGMTLANSEMSYTTGIGKHYKQIGHTLKGVEVGIEYLAVEKT